MRPEAAKRAGVRRIVKMSAIKAAPDAPTTIRRWHGEIEQRINRSGIAYTHLWPNAFMQNFQALRTPHQGTGRVLRAGGRRQDIAGRD